MLQQNTPFGLYHNVTEHDLGVLSKVYSILLTGILSQSKFLDFIKILEDNIKNKKLYTKLSKLSEISEILNVCNKILEYKNKYYSESEYIVIVNRIIPISMRI